MIQEKERALKDKLFSSRLFLPLAALSCALLWGSAFPAIKTAYLHLDKSNLTLVFFFAGLRFTIAGFLVLLFTKQLGEQIRKTPKVKVLTIAFTQVVLL